MDMFYRSLMVGATQTVVGYPFDTLKTLMQSGQLGSWWRLNKKRPWVLYRGAAFPFVADALYSCTVFPVYHKSLDHTESKVLSGAVAGVAASPLLFVFDTNKVLRQIGLPPTFSLLRRPGKVATTARETIAMSVYFSSYDYWLRYLSCGPSGALAGLLTWTATYPIDVVRTRQMHSQISIAEAVKMGGLWRGYSMCATRAIVVNYCVFSMWEKTKS